MEFQRNNFFRKIIPVCFLVFLIAGIYSCNNSDVINNGSIPTIDTSILVTDETGRILGGDYSDWCYGTGAGERSFGVAYPNPTNDVTHVNFSLPSNDTISIFFIKDNDTTFLAKNSPSSVGYYSISISGSALRFSNSYRRLYINNKSRTYTSHTGCNYFGDIHFR
jgi:hypothetical protein